MRAAGKLGLVAAGFFLLGAVRCAYSPDFPNGTLKCATSDHSCPDGYSCDTPSNTCWKSGQSPTTGAAGMGGKGGSTGIAGAIGTAGAGGHIGNGTPCAGTCTIKIDGTLLNSNAPSADSKFVGHWVYQAGSTETVVCTDGSDKTNDLTGDYVDITLTGGVLTGSYFCDWNLTVGPAGNLTIIKPNQSCSRNVTDAKTGVTHFTWHGTTFTFKPDDSKPGTGTLTSMIGVDYVDDPSKTGCTP